MPILLTNPYLDCPLAKIKDFVFHPMQSEAEIVVQYGDYISVSGVVGEQWMAGQGTPDLIIPVRGSKYTDIIEEEIVSGDNNSLYAGVRRVLYDYLLDNGVLVGTLIDD